MVEKLALPFPILSDPSGDVLRSIDAFDPKARIGLPTILVLDPRGREVLRYQGRDFADRPDDQDVLDALEALRAPERTHTLPVRLGKAVPGRRAYRMEDLLPYMRGVRSAAEALGGRIPGARAEPEAMQAMANRFLNALRRTQDVVRSRSEETGE